MSATRRPPKIARPGPSPFVESALEREFASASPARRGELYAAALAAPTWPVIRALPDGVLPTGAGPGAAAAEVTFFWRDSEASAVFLFLNRVTDETRLAESELRRLGDTDLWTRTVRMPRTWRASYAFLSHRGGGGAPWHPRPAAGIEHRGLRALLDSGRPDPRNPLHTSNRAGHPVSVVELADAPPQPWFRAPDGRVHDPHVAPTHSAPYGAESRALWLSVHRAAGSRAAESASLPVVVVLDGDAWCARFGLPDAVQRAVDEGYLPPLVLLGVDSVDTPTRWVDLDEQRTTFAAFLSALPAWAGEHLGVPRGDRDVHASDGARAAGDARAGAGARAVLVGQSLGGRLALELLAGRLTPPDPSGATPAFDAAVSLSASLWGTDPAERTALVPPPDARVSLHVGTQEWALIADHRALTADWAGRDIPHHYTEFTGGHDYACWRSSIIAGLHEVLSPRTPLPRLG